MMKKSFTAFTLIELLVIVGILVLLTVIAIPAFRIFQKESDLDDLSEEIINALRLAQNKTLASEGASQYGVYFDNKTIPHQYTLFKGSNYSLRDIAFDEIHKLPKIIEFKEINLAGGSEVIFNRITGKTNQAGSLSLELKTDPTKSRTIYVEESGKISIASPALPSDAERKKDSRHLHFNYIRAIDTATEKLILTLDSTVTKEIIISNYLKDSQFYWEGEVDVSGQTQILKIHTHRLNNPDSQFCIHRDRRYNNKSLIITISGDSSGSLVEYSADGLTTTKTSIYATDSQWQ